MKYSTLILLAALALGTQAHAGTRCGLGSKIFGGSKSIISQLLEITTDDPSYSSISYGTSGCKHNGFLLMDPIGKNDRVEEQLEFVNSNFEELLIEMANGRGETLNGLASTFGCGGDSQDEFAQMTKASYRNLVPASQSDDAAAEEMLSKVRETFRGKSGLRQKCGAV